MSQGKSTKDTQPDLPAQIIPSEGDIMVTAVGARYAIGRLREDHETQEPLASKRDRDEGLKEACALAGATHRVLLSARATHTAYLPVGQTTS